MRNLVERVARKMFADSSFYGEQDPDEIVERRLLRAGPIREPAWKAFEAAAHTAIEEHIAALAEAGFAIVPREPTEAMLDAIRAVRLPADMAAPATPIHKTDRPRAYWMAAIDAALISERGAEE